MTDRIDNPDIDDDYELDQLILRSNGVTILESHTVHFKYGGLWYRNLLKIPTMYVMIPRENRRNVYCQTTLST